MSKEIKTLEDTLQPYVEKALEGLEKGADFVIDMAPELLQEFYMWHFWSYVFFTGVSLLGMSSVITKKSQLKAGMKYAGNPVRCLGENKR